VSDFLDVITVTVAGEEARIRGVVCGTIEGVIDDQVVGHAKTAW
jgi:hypothetical protein